MVPPVSFLRWVSPCDLSFYSSEDLAPTQQIFFNMDGWIFLKVEDSHFDKMESIFSLYCILWQIPVIPFQKEERILLWFWAVKWRSSCQRGRGSRWKRHGQVSLATRPGSRTPKTRTLESIMPNSSLKWPCLAPLQTGDTPHPHFSNRSNIPYTFVSNEKKNNGETSFFFFLFYKISLYGTVFLTTHVAMAFMS